MRKSKLKEQTKFYRKIFPFSGFNPFSRKIRYEKIKRGKTITWIIVIE